MKFQNDSRRRLCQITDRKFGIINHKFNLKYTYYITPILLALFSFLKKEIVCSSSRNSTSNQTRCSDAHQPPLAVKAEARGISSRFSLAALPSWPSWGHIARRTCVPGSVAAVPRHMQHANLRSEATQHNATPTSRVVRGRRATGHAALGWDRFFFCFAARLRRSHGHGTPLSFSAALRSSASARFPKQTNVRLNLISVIKDYSAYEHVSFDQWL